MDTDISQLLENVIRQRFAGVQIDDVRIEPDIDDDGKHIFRVTVVFNAKNGLDAAKVKGLVRHMRSSLEERDDFAFPVVAFRSRSDDKRLKAAAA